MAVLTSRSVFYRITMFIPLAVTMHFFGSMTDATFHVFFMVDIRFESLVFPEILLAYPAPMAGGTGLFHGGLFLEDMTLHESSPHRIWSTDMTRPTTRMALTAIVVKGLVQLFVGICIIARPCFHGHPIGLQGDMKALIGVLNIVTIATHALRIRIRRIFDQTIVRGPPVRVTGVTAVTHVTVYTAMVLILLHKIRVHKHPFMRGQRLHLSASPLSNGFNLFRRGWPAFSDFSCRLDEHSGTGMAHGALACL
jgi:hypothetical protein